MKIENWNDFKTFIAIHDLKPASILNNNVWYIWAEIYSEKVAIELDVIDEPTEVSDFITNFQPLWNIPEVTPTQIETKSASPVWISSHSLGCRRTWWQHSIKLTGAALSITTPNSRVVNGITYDKYELSGNTTDDILDLTNGLLLNEDDIIGSSRSVTPMDHSGVTEWNGTPVFVPIVYVNGLVFPGYKMFADELGIFIPVSENGKTITVDCQRSDISNFDYIPVTGKALKLGLTEVNALNVDLVSEIIYFEVYVGNTLAVRRIYKSEADYIAASMGAPIKYNNWVFMQWDYRKAEPQGMDTTIAIKDSAQMKIVLKTESGYPFKKLDPSGPDPKLIITLHCTSILE